MNKTRFKTSFVRVIGGSFRGRKVDFLPYPNVRPTPNRIRETVFNWLAPNIRNTQVLDLFAGTGMLGIEAISRGAKHVDFVDKDPKVAVFLQTTFEKLSINKGEIFTQKAESFLTKGSKSYDIVFLDPPYKEKKSLSTCLSLLLENNALNKNALIYIESDSEFDFFLIGDRYECIKQKKAGNVYYWLLLAV